MESKLRSIEKCYDGSQKELDDLWDFSVCKCWRGRHGQSSDFISELTVTHIFLRFLEFYKIASKALNPKKRYTLNIRAWQLQNKIILFQSTLSTNRIEADDCWLVSKNNDDEGLNLSKQVVQSLKGRDSWIEPMNERSNCKSFITNRWCFNLSILFLI